MDNRYFICFEGRSRPDQIGWGAAGIHCPDTHKLINAVTGHKVDFSEYEEYVKEGRVTPLPSKVPLYGESGTGAYAVRIPRTFQEVWPCLPYPREGFYRGVTNDTHLSYVFYTFEDFNKWAEMTVDGLCDDLQFELDNSVADPFTLTLAKGARKNLESLMKMASTLHSEHAIFQALREGIVAHLTIATDCDY